MADINDENRVRNSVHVLYSAEGTFELFHLARKTELFFFGQMLSCSILSQHFFGLKPPHPIDPIPVEAPASLRRHRQFEHIHRLGPRAIEELAVEVANGEDLGRALSAYDRLTPEMLKATGGDGFPTLPIYEVQQS